MPVVRKSGLGAADVAIPFGSATLHAGDMVPGTGQTVQELLDIGYTLDDIMQMLEQGAASGIITAPGGGPVAGPFLSIAVGGRIYGASDVVPGTSHTVAQLGSQGMSESDIATLISAGVAANAAAAAQGGLPPGPSPRISTTPASSSLDSVVNWFTGSTLISGVPNFALLGGALLGLSLIGGGKRRR